jgi:hypothetical protein
VRTLLGGELTTALSWTSDVYSKLEVQNGSGTWIDAGALLNKGWVINARWGEHVNTPVSQATFTLLRNISTNSLAPFMESSPFNVDDSMVYSPLLELGRLVRYSTATMDRGVALDTGKYRVVFYGRIDSIEQTDNGFAATPIVINCSDLGSWLMDMQIEVEGRQYGSESGEPLQTVLQAIVDDNLPSGEPEVTVVKDSSSGFAVTAYAQGATKVLEGLIKIVLDSTGEDIRYRFDADHDYELTWFDPDRSRETVDQTVTTYNLRKLDTSIADIRNAGELPYTDSVTEESGEVEAENEASILKYRRRWFRMPVSSFKLTEPEAQAVIDAVVNDLSGAEADFAAQCPYLWFVQLFDRYTFPLDNRTYDDDQTFGVVGFQHSIENGRAETEIQCAGRIVGAYAEWLKRVPSGPAASLDVTVPPVLSIQIVTTDDDPPISNLSATVQGGPGTYVTRALARLDRYPTQAELDASTPSSAGERTGVFTDLVELDTGKKFFVAGRAYNQAGEGTVVAYTEGVWLGVDATPGADLTIGDIVAGTTEITYEVTIDQETSYVEVWDREFTTHPGGPFSVERVAPKPFDILSLGEDFLVPGVATTITIPLSGPENYQMTTWVPFDHLGKRGNVQSFRVRGSTGLQDPDFPDDPEDIPDLQLKLEASALVGDFALNDPIDVWECLMDPGVNDAVQADAARQPLLKQTADGVYVARFGGTEDASGDYLLTPYGVATNPTPADWTILVAYAPLGDSTFDYAPVVAGRDATWNSFFLHANPESSNGLLNNHTARLTWSPTGFQHGPEATNDEMAIALVRSGAGTDAIVDSYTNGDYIGSNGGGSPCGFATGLEIGAWTANSNFGHHDVAIIWAWNRKLTDAEVALAFEMASERVGTPVSPPTPGTPPDAPTNVVQTASTVDSITVDCTMPASAPDFIRITINSSRTYDVAVSVAGSATQSITITGLNAGLKYTLAFRSVEDDLQSLTAFKLTGETAAAGSSTLNTPTITSASYTEGNNTFSVIVTPGGNNPADTQFYLEAGLASGGPYPYGGMTVWNGTGTVTVSTPFPQGIDSEILFYRVKARKSGWTTSAYTTEGSIEVPGQ